MSNKAAFPKKTARTWEVPEKDIPRLLRMLDRLKKHDGKLARFRLFAAVEKMVPETKGVIVNIKLRGTVPYIEEAL